MSSSRRLRCEQNYKSAATDLQTALPLAISATLKPFPDFTVISDTEERARALGDAVEELIKARNEQRGEKRGCGDIVVGWFRASYPFANLLITVLKEGAAVSQPECGF